MADISAKETGGALKTTPEVDRGVFLSKLNESDQDNITTLATAFERKMKKKQQRGGMIVVGGILEKPLPRKDIDIRVVVETGKTRNDYETRIAQAMDRFNILEEITSQLVSDNPDLKIAARMEPAIDEEYQSPSILKHEGTIRIERVGATPIELLNTVGGTLEEEIRKQERPFAVIARVS
ncbi:MAG: hypothetical protein A3C27_03575 [Candidatus Levybacteria bacterium RIFCSPHIGHO2_02_FULL_39_36]|nr:MAG: hypothetical protein UT85_C0014G0012 [Candidatus Levybacteria bacterium GW2011_GWA2_40_16]OGH15510.1 MAG: hypothetical protein A2689_01400 [Candidatus Levybacteria bacterium RIFCSPHIGHO2_01_FULL_38_96]OGH25383.1 MAG: hypothetical protein A3E68_00310 [Candidatus Levybacteria bacterium RIFCSPHIGHO2_12_FULL_39_39]OGH27363.1 MAG: hypothetical protein A3C27_03575 [Candidatus Levybacteria bacterium RIFCSPHIGHO2_02_FULL_39_36]OGH36317.1 MAG: hypothetical protein A3B43_02100 [Candidatus Levybac